MAESALAAQTIAFLQELTEKVGTLDHVSLVVTLPSRLTSHFNARAEQLFQQMHAIKQHPPSQLV